MNIYFSRLQSHQRKQLFSSISQEEFNEEMERALNRHVRARLLSRGDVGGLLKGLDDTSAFKTDGKGKSNEQVVLSDYIWFDVPENKDDQTTAL